MFSVDVVVGSDIVFARELHRPLARPLAHPPRIQLFVFSVDVVVGSDIVFARELHRPLARLLAHLLNTNSCQAQTAQ